MAFPFRPISLVAPKKTRLVVIKEITPGPFHSERLRQDIRNVIHRTQTRMKNLFEETTETWATQVDWDEKESTASGIAYAEVSTDNELYYLLDHGAEAHSIVAENFPTLVFRGTYTSKTLPGTLHSRESFHSNSFRRLEQVDHPGFDPRDFEGQVREIVEPEFEEACEKALENFARKSGHHMD